MGKIYDKMDSLFEFFYPTSGIFVGFTMIFIYVKFLLPILTWSNWIIGPVWIISTCSLVWNLGYKDLLKLDINKTKEGNEE